MTDHNIFLRKQGYCPCCKQPTVFTSSHAWLRDHYKCSNCGSIPRNRQLIKTVSEYVSDLSKIRVYEAGGSGPSSEYLRRNAAEYTESQYWPDVRPGQKRKKVFCQDLESLTWPNDMFDLVITQDVMEHVFHPEKAFKEICRVLKPGGYHIFSVPIWKDLTKTVQRARMKDGAVEHLLDTVDHGGFLVTFDWSYDILDMISESSKMVTRVHRDIDPYFGIEGEFLDVLVSQKVTGSVRAEKPKVLLEGNIDLAEYADGILLVTGWSSDEENGGPVERVVIYLDSELLGPVTQMGIERPDVAEYFDNQNRLLSGWELRMKTRLHEGKHRAFAIAYNKREGLINLPEKEFVVEVDSYQGNQSTTVRDPNRFWQSLSKAENWRDFILPGRSDQDFDYEGYLEAQRLFYLFDGSSTVVDYGCGIGRVLKYVAERAMVAIGLDVNLDFLEKANIYVKDDKVLFFRSDQYHQENVADLVYSLMVLQHNDQENREKIMHHIFRILKPEGLALISFPRFESNYYEENEFLHKFMRAEVERYGLLFPSFRIIEGNLPNYVGEYDRKISHEYFLIAVK